VFDTISFVSDKSRAAGTGKEGFVPRRILIWSFPSWAMAVWSALFIVTAKVHPQSARSLGSRWVIGALTFSVVVSPFLAIRGRVGNSNDFELARSRTLQPSLISVE
jgi:hypothetical protein